MDRVEIGREKTQTYTYVQIVHIYFCNMYVCSFCIFIPKMREHIVMTFRIYPFLIIFSPESKWFLLPLISENIFSM